MHQHRIKGLKIEHDDGYFTCHISALTDEFKDCIRKHLRNICHGTSLASRDLGGYTYKRTIKAFHSRYTSKSKNIKKGMIGELLTHVIIYEFFDAFEVVSPYFNMEEKSQRKGFDLVLSESQGNRVWITEVKSGSKGADSSADSATSKFLNNAKADLSDRLSRSEPTFWHNAINSINTAVPNCTDYKELIIDILDDELIAASDGCSKSEDNHVILVSVLYNDIAEPFESQTTKIFSESINGKGSFKKVIAVSLQKSTYEKVADFLFEEELNGS